MICVESRRRDGQAAEDSWAAITERQYSRSERRTCEWNAESSHAFHGTPWRVQIPAQHGRTVLHQPSTG